jgi:hypothetical protein
MGATDSPKKPMDIGVYSYEYSAFGKQLRFSHDAAARIGGPLGFMLFR